MIGASLEVPDYGELIVDVAFGGNTFVWAWAEHMDVAVGPSNVGAVVDAGMALLQAANEQLVIRHPLPASASKSTLPRFWIRRRPNYRRCVTFTCSAHGCSIALPAAPEPAPGSP